MDTHPPTGGKSIDIDTGFYAGGHLTYYVSEILVFAGYARFVELNRSFSPDAFSVSDRTIRAGGKVRYLTFMPGVEIYASGGYVKCETDLQRGTFSDVRYADGAEFMAGVNIRLGGYSNSLVNIDRSNAIDTRAWACGSIATRS